MTRALCFHTNGHCGATLSTPCRARLVRPWVLGLVITDGGRADAGYASGEAGDCVARALTIATGGSYSAVYRSLADLSALMGKRRSARNGAARPVYTRWLAERGWQWTPTMAIGSGCTVHMRRDELPAGRLVVRLSGHLCAVLDGVVHDNHDPRRGGTRCVYGYWQQP